MYETILMAAMLPAGDYGCASAHRGCSAQHVAVVRVARPVHVRAPSCSTAVQVVQVPVQQVQVVQIQAPQACAPVTVTATGCAGRATLLERLHQNAADRHAAKAAHHDARAVNAGLRAGTLAVVQVQQAVPPPMPGLLPPPKN